jgi:hypothetical protein
MRSWVQAAWIVSVRIAPDARRMHTESFFVRGMATSKATGPRSQQLSFGGNSRNSVEPANGGRRRRANAKELPSVPLS